MNKKQHQKSSRRRWPIYLLAVAALLLTMEIVFDFFPEEDKRLRSEVRNAIESTFPEQAAELAKSYGMISHSRTDSTTALVDPKSPSVVLVHGLDDPGLVWMNLAPALTVRRLDTWEFRYPNDQQIFDSSMFLSKELKQLKALGVKEVIIISHSMGGLVSRELLTSPLIDYSDEIHNGEVPRVLQLIMVGPPNHGSEIARFRLFGELREQFVNMMENRGHILRGFLDGAGEAKIDLLPESEFLQTLNSRPHPEGLEMLIIAGVVSPWGEEDINRYLNAIQENGQADSMAAFLYSVSDGLGDGLVTVESTRLDGIDHVIVPGTHLSMIRNILADSERVPPAIPVILQHLAPLPEP
jgi:pimeloyl-ACP methyl ester carboxylesterase